MRKKLPKLNTQERKIRFKECLCNLDPTFSLDETFTEEYIREFQKRYSSKEYYFLYKLDEYRKIVGKVNSTGSRVRLTLLTKGLELNGVWYNNLKDRNIDIIEKYKEFKETSFQVGEREKEKRKFLAEQEKILLSLKRLVPYPSNISIDTPYVRFDSKPFEPHKFDINISNLTPEEVDNMIRKITK